MSIQPGPGLFNNFIDQIATQDDLADLSRQRLKISVEKILSAEPVHVGYPEINVREDFMKIVIAVTMATLIFWYNSHS